MWPVQFREAPHFPERWVNEQRDALDFFSFPPYSC